MLSPRQNTYLHTIALSSTTRTSVQVIEPHPVHRTLTFLGIDTLLDDGYTLLCLDGDDTINVTASCEVVMSMYPWCLTTSALLQAFDNAGEVRVVLKGNQLARFATAQPLPQEHDMSTRK